MSQAGTHAPAPQRVLDAIKRRLHTGEYAAGSRLPALRKLASEFDVSLGAVHTAIGRLEHEGLVTARHGSGVYVADRPQQTRTYLLLTRVTGHHWSDMANGFIQHFSGRSDACLLVEDIPAKDETRLTAFRAKLKQLVSEGVWAVLINGSQEVGIERVIDCLPPAADLPRVAFFSKRGLSGANVGGAWTDWHHGGYAGCRHLIEVGCKHIGILTPHGHEHGSAADLHKGCQLAAADTAHGVQLVPLTCSMESQGRDMRLRDLLQAHPQLDGVFAFSDYAASCTMAMLQQMGRRVPDDVAVLGYYDTPWSEAVTPRLSSVSTRTQDIVAATINLLDTGQLDEQIVIHPRLIIRESTSRP